MRRKNTESSFDHLKHVLPDVLNKIGVEFEKRPTRVIEAWPEIIGKQLAPMTKAIKVEKGCLFVEVKSATLYSLLEQYEKPRLLKKVQQKFSRSGIRKIVFRKR